jgi:nucleotidyltransferase/DNA polymerase involved in DNA repair
VEEIANPELAIKPFAVGQKQIIVTSNYVARSFGVKKLMSREEAKKTCPELIIIEGSDLEPYRLASQSIYKAFRDCIKELSHKMPLYHATTSKAFGYMEKTTNPVALKYVRTSQELPLVSWDINRTMDLGERMRI